MATTESASVVSHDTSNASKYKQPEDEVHQRASRVLQWATSLESSNNRRRRQLQQIESGRTNNVQQEIEEIMQEKPANVLDLVKEVDPENLPSNSTIMKRYKKKTKTGDNNNKKVEEEEEDDSHNQDNFNAKQDQIVAEAKAPPPMVDHSNSSNSNIPLEEQLKRSYEAIVRLRENSDLRYEALEKKYVELKRAQLHNNSSSSNPGEESPAAANEEAAEGNDSNSNKEELKEAYEAIIRLRENSDLRYNVLESKYLDLKRSHAESDARNERLELELGTVREEVHQILEDAGDSDNLDKSALSGLSLTSANKRDSGQTRLLINKEEKKKTDKQQRFFMQEFQSLCEKVEDCEKCHEHVPHSTLTKVKDQLDKWDTEDELTLESETETKEDAQMLATAKRHEGAMELLRPNWDKLTAFEKKKTDHKPKGKFANLSEPKSEQKLRGKKSQFVAAQSGVYCRIDHDMQKQYGDLDQIEAPSKLQPVPPPAPAGVRDSTSSEAPPGFVKVDPPPPIAAVGDLAETPAPIEEEKPDDAKPIEPVDTKPTDAKPIVPKPIDPEMSPGFPGTQGPKPYRKASGSAPSFGAPSFGVGLSSISQLDAGLAGPASPRGRNTSAGAGRNPMRARSPTGPMRKSVPLPFGESLIKPPGDSSAARSPTSVTNPPMDAAPQPPMDAAPQPPKRSTVEPPQNRTKAPMPPKEVSPLNSVLNESGKSNGTDPLMDVSNENHHMVNEEFLQGRLKKIPAAKLDPLEKKAKKEAALREAKAAAKNVRKQQNKREKKEKSQPYVRKIVDDDDDDEQSDISGLSNVSSVVKVKKIQMEKGQKGKGLFKNPFKRKASKGGVPMEIIEEP